MIFLSFPHNICTRFNERVKIFKVNTGENKKQKEIDKLKDYKSAEKKNGNRF